MTGLVMVTRGGGCGGGKVESKRNNNNNNNNNENQQQVSVVEVLLAAIRKSLVSCRVEERGTVEEGFSAALHHMEIGLPTNVQHITHVTFDRFNGFLGLPVEFEVEIPCRVPSASASVFGVSAESMQCSYDSKGNSVPTILLLMQERLYSQEGLKAEGIFRINPENGQEEHVRDQLNRGIVPVDIDVHCLAGLIKAWFRELPSGVLDGLSPEDVLQCNTEEKSVELLKQLKPTESTLLNWAIELMADVVEEEEFNKMNARNIAMVFAPNMTQMSDPLTALMHAVQVMNLLKTLIMRTLREREETETGGYSPMSSHSSPGQSDGDFDSQQEMDASCEMRQVPSDYSDAAQYSPSTEDHDEVESLTEIEECFLRRLDENHPTAGLLLGQPSHELARECVSHISCTCCKMESGLSFTDSKNENSSSITSDDEDSTVRMSKVVVVGLKIDQRSTLKGCKMAEDTIMAEMDTLGTSILPMQSTVPDESI